MSRHIPFLNREMNAIFEAFQAVYGPDAPPSEDIPRDAKVVVYVRMIHALHPAVKPREARSYFLKSFHPDTGTDQLTAREKARIVATAADIFRAGGGKTKSPRPER